MTKHKIFRILPLGVIFAVHGYACDPGVATRTSTSNRSLEDLCAPPTNPIACENSKPGLVGWEIDWDGDGWGDGHDGDPLLQGFATDISVSRGDPVHFKVKTAYPAYLIDIYRLGYYGGTGARFMGRVLPLVTPPPEQPPCHRDSDIGLDTGLIDCGNWSVSASWVVPATAISGVYIAKLSAPALPAQSHIIFVVRDDTGNSDILFQTSDTTWQAYNGYDDDMNAQAGTSLYGSASKVSYNRPFNTRGMRGAAYSNASWLFAYEYPMIRWLEANGYDVSYTTGVDSDRRGSEIRDHKIFLSVGHDEYWSEDQRTNVEAARAAGVNLAFFSGNEVFWKTRWEESRFGARQSDRSHRTLVSYKESRGSLRGERVDPDPASVWTGTWRDPTFSPPLDGGRPANALTGSSYVIQVDFRPLTILPADSVMRLWRNSAVANRSTPTTLTGGCNCLIGHEWSEDSDNGFRPPGLIRASTTNTITTLNASGQSPANYYLLDNGETYGMHHATHHLVLYRSRPSSECPPSSECLPRREDPLVFGAGTCAWAWGLDGVHDVDPSFGPPIRNPQNRPGSTPEPAIQQATVNLFADMCDRSRQHCVHARTLQSPLVPGSPSEDAQPPTAEITSPLNGSSIIIGDPISISGSATDLGGGRVGGVEVSVDDGITWHPATDGRDHWSFHWMPTSLGPVAIRVRAVDDTGNLGSRSAPTNVTIIPRSSEALLFYNKVDGAQATGALTSAGGFVNRDSGKFDIDWTHVVTGTNNILVFYNSATGRIWLGRLSTDGDFEDIGEPAGGIACDLMTGRNSAGCEGWTHIVAGSNNLLLFYNALNGKALVGKLYPPVEGRTIPPAVGYKIAGLGVKQFAPGWTNIVVGVNNVVFFYDRVSGNAATAKLGIPDGRLTALQQVTGVAAGWTHIVAGVNNVLLFFKSTPGNAMSARLNDIGSLTVLRNPLWNTDTAWTSIAAGMKNNVLLFYRSSSGEAATKSLDADGNYVPLLPHNGFSPGWTHIIGP